MAYGLRSALFCACAIGALNLASAAHATEAFAPSRTLYGEVGLLDMPSADMSPDGQIGFTFGAMNNVQRINLSFQALPWFEGSFRYSHLVNVLGNPSLYDRSFSFKMRLSQEDDFWPGVSVGIRDLLGTGVYGGEYIVASKSIGDFELTAGLGWGRLAGNNTFPNPFGLLIKSFKQRAARAGGGQVDFGLFFHGPNTGLFGGAIWRTPIENLNLTVEYSSDQYKREVAGGGFKVNLPVNIGLSYKPTAAAVITAGYMYGSTWGLSLTYALDTTHYLSPDNGGVPAPPPVVRADKVQSEALAGLMQERQALVNTPTQTVENRPARNISLSQAMLGDVSGVIAYRLQGDTLHLTVSQQSADCDTYMRAAAQTTNTIRSVDMTNMQSGERTACGTAPKIQIAAAASVRLDVIDATGAAVHPAQLVTAAQHSYLRAIDASNTGGGGTDIAAIKKKIATLAAQQGLQVQAIAIGTSEATIYYRNMRYFSEADGAGRLMRVAMAQLPGSVEIVHLVIVDDGVPLREIRAVRSAMERVTEFDAGPQELHDALKLQGAPMQTPALDAAASSIFPRYTWSLSPRTRESVFDPNAPIQVQVLVAAEGTVELLPGLELQGRGDLNVFNNFNGARISSSLLPHVRSDVELYLTKGASGISYLSANYRTRITPTVFVKFSAGYLEDMFAGVGGQILWRPDNSRFAVGADIYEVWQRNFDRLFGVQKYHVLTGHVSVYYQLPWYGINTNIHIGRYLARDYGATIEVTRRFDSGIELGAFATFTNVPFSKFGEGSFDKGIILRAPLEWALPLHSTTNFDLTLRSLSRDGGQRVDKDDSLYIDTLRSSYGELERHLNEVTNP